jgi:soluble lytic murein transglycosylase
MLSGVTQGSLGIDQEPTESFQILFGQARRFVRFKRKTLSSAEQSALQRECSIHAATIPFCQEIRDLQSDENQGTKHRVRTHKTPRGQIAKYAHWIRSGNLENLKPIPEEDVISALKKIRFPSEIESATQAVFQSSSCPNSTLSWLLGVKTEEFLPVESARKTAIQLYEKSIQCSTEINDTALKVRLRLSLLKIWENDCSAALPHLKFLSEHPTSTTDFAPRALFWQYQCGAQLKKSDLSNQSKKELIQRYPVSLQTVLAQIDEKTSGPNYSSRSDSPIQMRLANQPLLNQRVRAIEALIKLEEPRYAQDLLNQMEQFTDRTPTRFRLYLAALYFRVDESIHRFKLLSAVFKEDPELISKSSLELFYPHLSSITTATKVSALDRMLLLSLIRQESAFNKNARSPAGAMGLMQIMPRTARRFFRLRNAKQLYNPNLNLEVGSRYFSNLLRNYGGDAELALAAYNAGPKRVEECLKRYPVKDRALFLDLIPYRETRDYISSIARNYFWYVSLYSDRKTQPFEGRRTLGKVFNLFRSS